MTYERLKVYSRLAEKVRERGKKNPCYVHYELERLNREAKRVLTESEYQNYLLKTKQL